MENLDLNIENYELEDILNLFQLSYDFNELSLKKAKHIVKRTHPDKSKLKPEIFIFFLKAYKVLYHLFEFSKILVGYKLIFPFHLKAYKVLYHL